MAQFIVTKGHKIWLIIRLENSDTGFRSNKSRSQQMNSQQPGNLDIELCRPRNFVV